MEHQELEQILRYRLQELQNRLSEIKHDFEDEAVVDDILFSIAQCTKSELRNVRQTLEKLENGEFDSCCECHKRILEELKKQNPFQTPCDSCDNQKNWKK